MGQRRQAEFTEYLFSKNQREFLIPSLCV
ncbi:hypothetical protein MPNT_100072 [Candidatus Methylacidithermus pantelleriae]|uniref:Uncharacterized protein n=1 Tax=Candidatus Methylacidithermus pantelleriae TaxID=2744239 RepID=A0A8J2BRD2_9BACT|nr:hypothetical protein MPNT_100072 [Candidatus Methylacidithermus pantelleriae]